MASQSPHLQGSIPVYKTTIIRNALHVVPFPQTPSGYKDKYDACHRADRQTFISAYKANYAAHEDKPLRFRQDGLPVSAQRVPGKPLMSPKLPNFAELSTHKRRAAKQQRSIIQFGDPHLRDTRRYATMSATFHCRPPRLLDQPNAGIAADTSKRLHQKLGYL